MIKTGFSLIIFCCVFAKTTVYAGEQFDAIAKIDSTESDQALLDELMDIVDESTEVVTKTRMNANSVPGTVTVLHGKELETLGITTAWDALSLVPGILPTRDQNGRTSVVARGLNFPFSSGNIKILVNSLSMSRETSGANSSILLIPIEQIQRIEVVRGPGAMLNGDNAFMGSVNIITYTGTQRLFTRAESSGAINGGGMGSYHNEEHQLQVHGNIFAYDNNSADAPSGDFASEERQFGVFSVKYHGLSLAAQSYHRDYQKTSQGLNREGSDIFAAQQHLDFTPTFSTDLNFSFLQNDFNTPNSSYKGDKINGSVDFNWTGLKNHQWWFRFSYTDESIDDFSRQRLAPPGRPAPPEEKLSDLSRRYYSLSIQDQFELTDELTVTASMQFNHRDDLGKDFFSPRIAAVWRVNEHHILKAQYAEGFRVPTFNELFLSSSPQDIKQVTIGTSELSYIYHQAKYTGKITLFYSQVEDMITPVGGGNFDNGKEAESMGIEVEWEHQLTEQIKWQANLSYIDSWTTRNDEDDKKEDQVSSDWLSNVTVFYQPVEKIMLSAHWNYVGQLNSPVVHVADKHTLNITVSTFDILTKGLGFKVGVKNLLHNDEKYVQSGPESARTPVLDYGDKAMLWAQFSYQY